MKRTVKLLLAAAFVLCSGSAFAQKFARVDYQGILPLMPEMAAVQTNIQKVYADQSEILESISVERNKKIDEASKLPETASETAKQLKNREVMEISQRLEEFTQIAQEAVAKAQRDELLPLKTKLDAAIKKVCKAQGITAAYQVTPADQFPGELVYMDDSVVDITMAVRAELGIAADAVPVTDAAAVTAAATAQ